eukprot:CAMPEP_0119305060 /NCGR_PEP_ID=MMETSP1333-20130426/6141_1 /TAXON_ID=418940 /ORGANISM="Scyphosphaera apsteinii, Strain RCC1455" /LENGTH=346 /DNA_ID=CAMNT_0007308061 /DNA_START=80 /DNA_END=1120 /DNA_ORIENTATION=-
MTTTQELLSLANTRPATPIKMPIIEALRDGMPKMQVLEPGDDDFEEERKRCCFDLDSCPHLPAAIVQPTTAREVCAVVKATSDLNHPLIIAGSGDDHECMTGDVVLLDMSRMNSVTVDAEARLVTAEGGAKLEGIVKVCNEHNRTLTTCSHDTGEAGLPSPLDIVHSAEIALPSGVVVIATPENEYSAQLWGASGDAPHSGVVACRGTNLGVILKLTRRVYPIARNHAHSRKQDDRCSTKNIRCSKQVDRASATVGDRVVHYGSSRGGVNEKCKSVDRYGTIISTTADSYGRTLIHGNHIRVKWDDGRSTTFSRPGMLDSIHQVYSEAQFQAAIEYAMPLTFVSNK